MEGGDYKKYTVGSIYKMLSYTDTSHYKVEDLKVSSYIMIAS